MFYHLPLQSFKHLAKRGQTYNIKDALSILFFKIKNIYVSIKLMSNMVHDKYVQQRGTCTHIASKCHKYFTDSIKKSLQYQILMALFQCFQQGRWI